MRTDKLKIWLSKENYTPRVQGDIISRLKKIETELTNIKIDKEYDRDQCRHLLTFFYNKGINKQMNEYPNVNLPLGKYTLGNYRYALYIYIKFRESV